MNQSKLSELNKLIAAIYTGEHANNSDKQIIELHKFASDWLSEKEITIKTGKAKNTFFYVKK
jgi:hypothetical protein